MRAAPTRPSAEAWRRFRRHRLAFVSLLVLGAIILGVAFDPLLWPVPTDEIDFEAIMGAPDLAHPLGTDDLGRDLLARMIYGGRISVAVGLAAMAVSVIVGTLVGALAGWSRGVLDPALMWLTDLFLSCPSCRSSSSSSTSSGTR